ncbi:hypothetical protein ELI02_02260 [Rhizobium leguminosarum]|uniref:hypothetical protein n=1 Tax=Rhizobium leguminosarum TaxID=384 RepID=UPI00103195CA|nr:hypothetical protein [Rhizobium leguminosarum]TAX58942.1 hypothetical protein ELI02_02260 [Rhizobium leguminosarum]
MVFHPDRVRPAYQAGLKSIREGHGDEVIEDWLERYHASPDVDRDDVMTALQIEYIGTFYELVTAYEVDKGA